jgi:hypothetical protein
MLNVGSITLACMMNSLNLIQRLKSRRRLPSIMNWTSMVPLFVDDLTPPACWLSPLVVRPPPHACSPPLVDCPSPPAAPGWAPSLCVLLFCLFLFSSVPAACSFAFSVASSLPLVYAFRGGVPDFHPRTTFQFTSSSSSSSSFLLFPCCCSNPHCPCSISPLFVPW